MSKFRFWLTAAIPAAIAVFIAGCGGSDSAFAGGGGGGGTTSSSSGGVSTAATIVLVSDSSSIFSDGSNHATLTAYVRDANNQFLAGALVMFAADSGGLTVTQSVTDTNGVATATLDAAGDPTARNITVTATTGALTSTALVAVAGSTLTVQGASPLTVGQVATYTVKLADYGNHAVAGKTVTLTASSAFVTLSATSVVTDSTGTGTFTVTGATANTGTVTATAIGLSQANPVTVTGGTNVTITAPAAATEITLGTAQTVTANFASGGVGASGHTINFSTTRGTLSAATAVTDGSGNASVTITSNNAGGAVITAAEATSNTSANVSVEFVATTPASLDLQPSLFTISPGGTSTLTAIVRDAAGNLVKNQTVVFTLTDVTGGTLSVGSAVTNSQGSAQTVYTAGTVTSANNGVNVVAKVQTAPAVTDTVSLTVAGQQVFIQLGTGNKIEAPNTVQYKKDYIVQVTDSTGAGVANVPLSLKVLSQFYWKGDYGIFNTTLNLWQQTKTAGPCADEDVNHNGVLDAGEDFNTDGVIEAGNVATVTPSSATTDANGFATISVYYPKDHAQWVQVILSALASVSGTEFARSTSFVLPVASEDLTSPTVSPPGYFSPYGDDATCSDAL